MPWLVALLAGFQVTIIGRIWVTPEDLYLMCYAWQRYRQLSDNLVDAMAYHPIIGS